jgi:ABC-type multidrug transport system fused ATPase/permease subunit
LLICTTVKQQALSELFQNRTVIAITHRLPTLRAMDRIVVIEDGSIVENGSPQSLLEKPNSVFKKMWEKQKSGFI